MIVYNLRCSFTLVSDYFIHSMGHEKKTSDELKSSTSLIVKQRSMRRGERFLMLRRPSYLLRISRFPCTGGLRFNSQSPALLPFQSSAWLLEPSDREQKKFFRVISSRQQYPKLSKHLAESFTNFVFRLNEAFDKLRHDASFTNMHNTSLDARNQALNILFEEIIKQIENYDSRAPFKFSLDEAIQPRRVSNLIQQLVNIKLLHNRQWSEIIGIEEVTESAIFEYILEKHLGHILFNEVLPKTLPSVSLANRPLDLSNPSTWYPKARELKRTIVMHLGPTNSGKTFNALQKLKQCNRGYYAGPLRLLAREAYERFRKEGLRCNLSTGEEMIDDLDSMGNKAGLTSGTIEMISLTTMYDVVVLDEIQMMGDTERGWAWTNALLGARAKEIHVCGEGSVLPLIHKIAAVTGDNVVVKEYERLGGLVVEPNPIARNFKNLKPGDCLIAFSKKRILKYKLEIERTTNFKVAVVYGSLPPEIRAKQAAMFNSGESEILVASDAIGMGLNLSIKRVIFLENSKFNGTEQLPLEIPIIKQIAGRAGRFKSDSGEKSIGYVSALDRSILKTVKDALATPTTYLETARIWPPDNVVEKLMTKYPTGYKLSALVEQFEENLKTSSNALFSLSDISKKIELLQEIESSVKLSVSDMLKLSYAPVKRSNLVLSTFLKFCKTVAKKESRSIIDYSLPLYKLNPEYTTDDTMTLENYEELHQIIVLFMWMHIRYPTYFIDIESAIDFGNNCEYILFQKLLLLKRDPYIKKSFPIKSPRTYRSQKTN
ncbi:HHL205Cp [Eremothecium sinecaudum]|uniref:ATP-dependent RNA helicase SUV3, mitochondrial n=1 Tax=Eremothecium sinecaudum TaxID=45286 RepID=A0A0X8HW92_9SACH|nr:HHL205Cp [Eremothecium sinecaudum]AMD22565.1 HHL205Cp [Eremothecium sinecaudum]